MSDVTLGTTFNKAGGRNRFSLASLWADATATLAGAGAPVASKASVILTQNDIGEPINSTKNPIVPYEISEHGEAAMMKAKLPEGLRRSIRDVMCRGRESGVTTVQNLEVTKRVDGGYRLSYESAHDVAGQGIGGKGVPSSYRGERVTNFDANGRVEQPKSGLLGWMLGGSK